MSRGVSEAEFGERMRELLIGVDCGSVVGPGRSGAVAAVYASHILHVPFIPYGALAPVQLGRVLVIDTARESGSTIRKAAREYEYANPIVLVAYEEPPRVRFWYEVMKPQHYRHERIVA